MRSNIKSDWWKGIFTRITRCFSNQVQQKVDSIISKIQSRNSIRLAYDNIPKSTWNEVKYTKASQQDLRRLLKYLKLFNKEFSKYPKRFIKKSNLKWVVFVKELSYSKQLRAAVPDCDKGILFLDFARASYNQTYQRHMIHHEFYHMLEAHLQGYVYWKDPNWAKLNDSDFKYGKGGITVQHDSMQSLLTHPKQGFVNLYSISGLEEDKAEIYGCLFVKSESRKLHKWIGQDNILSGKVQYMKAFLAKCCSGMIGEYWENYNVAQDKQAKKDHPADKKLYL